MVKKLVVAMLIVLTFVPIVDVCAANTREVSVYLYRDYPDCVFFVSWENADQPASISIKTPGGTMIQANDQNAEFGKGKALINVGTANSGYWKVYVTGEDLGMISVSGGSKNSASSQYNAIRSFEADVSDGYINFKWDVITENDTVSLYINATQGGYYGTYTLWQDYSASRSGSASVSTDKLQTGLYRFTIQVYDGRGNYTLSTEKPLYIKHPQAPAKLEDIRVGSVDGELFATWAPQGDGHYVVTLYDFDTLAVITTDWVYGNFYTIELPDDTEKVKFSVAYAGDEAYGEFDVYEVIYAVPAGTITFPDYSSTREDVILVNVDCPPDVTAGVYLDGTLLIEDAGAGDYELNLSEGEHEVLAYLKDKYGNIKTFTKIINVDKTPPVVSLNYADSIRTTNDHIILEGMTEPNAVVAVNGIEHKLDSGKFTAKIKLEKGVNPITITAYDLAGNKSVKTITVNKENANGDNWIIYTVPGALFLALTAWYIYLNRKQKGAQDQ